MKGPRESTCTALSVLLLGSALAQAASVTGTVTNKTTNRPSAGDTVALVDIRAGMADAASTKTDSSGRYSLSLPGVGAYLVRVTHQGASYFIAAPQSGAGDVIVYDAAAKVDGVGVDADMFLMEAAGGMLRIHERFLIRNTSLPPKAQFSEKTFEVALPPDAELDTATTTRPAGMATNTRLIPLQEKNHFTFNTPIQPNKDEKETMFELQYHLPYSGKYTFRPSVLMPTDHLVVYLPREMKFNDATGASFQPAQEDPKVQTFVARNVTPGQSISFTISGDGQMQGSAGAESSAAGSAAAAPGGGIGAPIGSPDPLTKYKGWMLGSLALLLVGAAAFLLRRGKMASSGVSAEMMEHAAPSDGAVSSGASTSQRPTTGSIRNEILLSAIKEELFELESQRLSGKISEEDYAKARGGLEVILKRTLTSRGPQSRGSI